MSCYILYFYTFAFLYFYMSVLAHWAVRHAISFLHTPSVEMTNKHLNLNISHTVKLVSIVLWSVTKGLNHSICKLYFLFYYFYFFPGGMIRLITIGLTFVFKSLMSLNVKFCHYGMFFNPYLNFGPERCHWRAELK